MNSQNKLIQQLSSQINNDFFHHKNLHLHYIKTGNGKPLILLHGATMGWGQWATNIDQLAQSFTIFAIDLPGSGLSTKVDFRKYSFKELFVDPIIQFINYHSLKDVHVIGHSTGGLIASHLVSSVPDVKDAILVNPVGLGKHTPIPFRLLSLPGLASLLTKILIGKSKKKLKIFLSDALYRKESMTDTFVDYVYESTKFKGWRGPLHLISIMASFLGIKNMFMALDIIRETDKNILIVWGQYDTTFDLKEVKDNIKAFPNVKMMVMKEVAHVPNIEHSKEFNKIVLQFFKKDKWN